MWEISPPTTSNLTTLPTCKSLSAKKKSEKRDAEKSKTGNVHKSFTVINLFMKFVFVPSTMMVDTSKNGQVDSSSTAHRMKSVKLMKNEQGKGESRKK